MNSISIDIETFSSANLQKCGVYRYAESDDFEILLFGYSVDGGAVQVVDLACGEKIPNEIINALMDNSVTKWAFNVCMAWHKMSRLIAWTIFSTNFGP
jgi:DNA polymerase